MDVSKMAKAGLIAFSTIEIGLDDLKYEFPAVLCNELIYKLLLYAANYKYIVFSNKNSDTIGKN
jgi:hypothetical protein